MGTTASGAAIGAGTDDNMAAALGLDLAPGDAVVSLGTSGTAFAVTDAPVADPSGLVAGFADATVTWPAPALAPALLGAYVVLPVPGEYVAAGAARQAAWAVSGPPEPPSWDVATAPAPAPLLDEAGSSAVRSRYADVLAGAADSLA